MVAHPMHPMGIVRSTVAVLVSARGRRRVGSSSMPRRLEGDRMSHLQLPSGDDHPEAAGKHLADAQVLLAAARADGSAYLAGYVVECALKSICILEQGSAARTHDLNALSLDALRLAALPGARTARYVPRMTAGHSLYDTTSGWRETLRYRAAGAVTPADAGSWLAEAQAVYESTIVSMCLDGVV
jgi:hypothetical protein